MMRHLFVWQCPLALVLCLGASVMWVCSFRTGESFARMSDGLSEPAFQSARGKLFILRHCCCRGTTNPPRWSDVLYPPEWADDVPGERQGFEFAGFGVWSKPRGNKDGNFKYDPGSSGGEWSLFPSRPKETE